jgi:hypothetical protein
MWSVRSRYRWRKVIGRALGEALPPGFVAIVACTPAFHEGAPNGGGSGAESSGRPGAGMATGSSGEFGHGGSKGGSPSGAGAGGSAGVMTSHRGGSADRSGNGGSGDAGGEEPRGGSESRGGSEALGGGGSQAGASPQGGAGTGGGNGGGGGIVAGAGGLPFGGSAGGIIAAGQAGIAGGPDTSRRCTPATVIDDMEDGDHLTCANQDRSGDWWTAAGPNRSIAPPTDQDFPAYALGSSARSGSLYGMRLSGTGFGHTDDDWASLGFFLAGGGAYSLASYTGIAFYAKATAPLTVEVTFATATTTPTSEGGDCTDDCNDHYAYGAAFTTSWREIMVPFGSLAQEGWGPKAKDLEHTLFVYFGFVGSTDATSPASFDFLIDDVRLY